MGRYNPNSKPTPKALRQVELAQLITYGLINGGEYLLVATHECEKSISIANVRFRLNSFELLPKETNQFLQLRVMRGEIPEVYKCGDVTCRCRGFEDIAVP